MVRAQRMNDRGTNARIRIGCQKAMSDFTIVFILDTLKHVYKHKDSSKLLGTRDQNMSTHFLFTDCLSVRKYRAKCGLQSKIQLSILFLWKIVVNSAMWLHRQGEITNIRIFKYNIFQYLR